MLSLVLALSEKPINFNMPSMLADPRVRVEIGYQRIPGNQPAEDEYPGLNAKQKHRMFQLAVQRLGWNALTHPEMVARLGLSSKAVDQLRDVITPKVVAPQVSLFVQHASTRLVRVPEILGPERWRMFEALRGRPVEGICAEDLPWESLGIPVTTLNDVAILTALGVSPNVREQWQRRRRTFMSEAEFLEAFRVSLPVKQRERARQLILQSRGPESILQVQVAWDLKIRAEDRASLFSKLHADHVAFLNSGPLPKQPVVTPGQKDAPAVWMRHSAATRVVMEKYRRERRERVWGWLSADARGKFVRSAGVVDSVVSRGPSVRAWE